MEMGDLISRKALLEKAEDKYCRECGARMDGEDDK